MNVDLSQLGITTEQVLELVVERIVSRFLGSEYLDEDGDTCYRKSSFAQKIAQKVEEAIDKRVDEIAQQNILPFIGEAVDALVIQKTNQYGEKKGEPATFTEYVVESANTWLQEEVDYEGKPVTRRGYGTVEQTRLAYEINKMLRHEISGAMKTATNGLGEQVGKSIQETLKIQLKQFTDKMRVEVKA